MNSFVKARLLNRANGAFKSHALLIKVSGDFYLVAPQDSLNDFPGEPTAVPGCTIISGHGNAPVIRKLYGGQPADSFVSAMIFFHTLLSYATFGLELSDTVSTLPSSIILDQMFVQEQQAQQGIGGVCIKTGYTQRETYSGMVNYHGHRGRGRFNTPVVADKPWRFGVELECYARNRNSFQTITSARSNWFMCEGDGSLRESIGGVSGLGIEIKSIPLKACDAKSVDFWKDPMNRLKELAVSNGHSTTGLHVHISREILGSTETIRQKNLAKLCTFYTYYVEDDPVAHQKNATICGREQGYSGELARCKGRFAEFSKKLGFTMKQVLDSPGAEDVMNETREGVSGQRWDINILNWNSYGTIEFRKADGRISRTRLAAVCTWWEQMCLYCVETHPKDFDFNVFFDKVCREYPAVAYFFQGDEEA